MELILYLILLQIVTQQPQPATDPVHAPEVEVLRFSWSEFRRPALDPRIDEFPSISKSQERIFAEEINNKNTIENRSRDMRIMEQRVSRDLNDTDKLDTQYRYTSQFRNRSTKTVRAVFWDYQSGDPANDVMSHRQFRCGVKIKPDEQKQVEAYILLPPHRTIVAATGKGPPERVVLNRVEFVDGTFWQRADWVPPAEILEWTGGRCRGFI